MSNKLQELTDKLYNEGLSKGKKEGQQLLNNARYEADNILSSAKEKAEAIVAEAEKKASDIRSKAESDLKMASAQTLQATKKDIENLLVSTICYGKTDQALSDSDFIKETIAAVARNFSATEGKDISLVLPESLRNELEPWVANELNKALASDIKAEFSKKITGGFTIGPKDGGWFISLSDETFKELIAEYIRPVTRKLLFGE